MREQRHECWFASATSEHCGASATVSGRTIGAAWPVLRNRARLSSNEVCVRIRIFKGEHVMRPNLFRFLAAVPVATAMVTITVIETGRADDKTDDKQAGETARMIKDPKAVAEPKADSAAPPIFVKTIPAGYRDWRLISVAHEEGDLKDIRAVLGNDKAIKAYRAGKLPFPEGTIIARLAWDHVPSEENNKAFGKQQSFIAGEPKNGVQFMVKDSKKYASTGGWGYAEFNDGKPAADDVLEKCFPCHQAVAARDYVFTRYSR
jgi:hypothetical protein